jgi:hypothetical protein
MKRGSSILLFRHATDHHLEELARLADKNQLQRSGGGTVAYSRQIEPAGRASIVDHCRAHCDTEQPFIDHHGIGDHLVERASVSHYSCEGRWLRLSVTVEVSVAVGWAVYVTMPARSGLPFQTRCSEQWNHTDAHSGREATGAHRSSMETQFCWVRRTAENICKSSAPSHIETSWP